MTDHINELSTLSQGDDYFDRRNQWCDLSLTEFTQPVPEDFTKNTISCIRILLGAKAQLTDLRSPQKFQRPAQWALYWCLAHASRAANLAAVRGKREDGISQEFVNALAGQVQLANRFVKDFGRLEIAYSSIHDNAEPALKEKTVGSDILLIVGGENLISNGVARIIWIQAKRAERGRNPFLLDFSEGSYKGEQFEQLSKVNAPEKGSFGFYIQYTNLLPYIPAIYVGYLDGTNGRFSANVRESACRLAEVLVYATGNIQHVGAFESIEQLKSHLDEVSSSAPTHIVTATASSNGPSLDMSSKDLLSELQTYFDERFALPATSTKKLKP